MEMKFTLWLRVAYPKFIKGLGIRVLIAGVCALIRMETIENNGE